MSDPGGHTHAAYHFHCVNKAWTSRDWAKYSTLSLLTLGSLQRHQYAGEMIPPWTQAQRIQMGLSEQKE